MPEGGLNRSPMSEKKWTLLLLGENPDEIRRSKSDEDVYLFYKAEHEKRWICAVSKQTDDTGFLITTYPTDAIKEGTQVWHK